MILTTIYPFRVKPYGDAIYIYGTNRLTARTEIINGVATTFPGVASGYYVPVEQYAATGKVNGTAYPAGFTGYTRDQIDNALAQGWLTQQEYDETISYIPV